MDYEVIIRDLEADEAFIFRTKDQEKAMRFLSTDPKRLSGSEFYCPIEGKKFEGESYKEVGSLKPI